MKTQKEFVEKNIQPIIDRYHHDNDGSVSNEDLKKITNYYGIGSPVLAGEAMAFLRNKPLSTKERKALSYMASLTGLFDDFFDKGEPDIKRLMGLIDERSPIEPETTHEKLFCSLMIQASENIKDTERLREFSERVFQVQINSLLQKRQSTAYEDLIELSKEKGGYSMIFYRCALEGEINAKEFDCLYKGGELFQLANDIFDIHKDLKEGVRTYANEIDSAVKLKEIFTKEQNEIFKFCLQTNPRKETVKFLERLRFVSAQCQVALNQLIEAEENNGGKFNPKEMNRSDLVLDMGLKINFLKATKEWIKN